MISDIFEPERVYDDSDAELDIIANKARRAHWRYRREGPGYIKFGRKVKYLGADLNNWVESNRVLTSHAG